MERQENVALLHLIISLQSDAVIYFNSWSQDKEKAEEIDKLYKEYREVQDYVDTKAEEIQNIATNLLDESRKIRENNNRNIAGKLDAFAKG